MSELDLDLDAAGALLRAEWGLDGTLASLGSHEDLNVLVTTAEGRFVLKVTAPTTDAGVVEAQSAGLARLAGAGLPFATPHVVPTVSGAAASGSGASSGAGHDASEASPGSASGPSSVAAVAAPGPSAVELTGPDGTHRARVLTWVDGVPLASARHLAPVVRRALGDVAGRTASALSGLSHPALDRPFTWDLRAFASVVDAHVGSVADPERRALATSAATAAAAALGPLAGSLRVDTIHADVTDLNVVAATGADGRPVPCGLIDVGDLSTGWVVAEAAVAACSAVAHDLDTPLAAVTDVVAGFDEVLPLTDDEVAALWWLVVARSAVLCTTTEHQVVVDPDNAYVGEAVEREWASLAALAAVPPAVAHQALLLALGRMPTPAPGPAVAVAVAVADQEGAGGVVDLSTTSPLIGPGAWESPEAMAALLAGLAPGTVARHGEGRPVAPLPTPREPATVSLGATAVLAPGTEVVAPVTAVVGRADAAGLLVLTPAPTADRGVGVGAASPGAAPSGPDLVLRGLSPAVAVGDQVAPGQVVGHVAPAVPVLGTDHTLPPHDRHQEQAPTELGTDRALPGHDRHQERPTTSVPPAPELGTDQALPPHDRHQEPAPTELGTDRALPGHDRYREPWVWPSHLHVTWAPTGVVPPREVRGTEAAAWLACCPDPSPLLGLPPGAATAERPDPGDLLRRRAAVLAGVQEHYWDVPPVVERGWRATLLDTDGRPYLDAVNNVAALGHSHPAITAAVTGQLTRLNTNSRFHYEAAVAYAERLAALLPDPLDTVFLVNTGSEACDLALRLVRSVTGRPDVLALAGAYHGWTMATDAVSTSLFDNPAALGSRPDWVHLVEAPNTYRGRFRDPADAGARYAADVDRAVAELADAGRAPAGFIAEPLSGNAGGIVLPPGYLAAAYARVRAAGGLCIADEVQTGLGRLGDWFWAFASQDVVPDVVTVAKATGNGVACGAVVTSRAVADAFAAEGSFFSSVGGSPVSAAAGLAVLDTLEAEGLQANARTVGAHLRRRLDDLVARFPLAGAVHGLGLYLGLELVRDDDRTPATAEARAVCERARELGVVLQPTGDGANVLKVKPPLCFTMAEADLLADVVEQALTDGW